MTRAKADGELIRLTSPEVIAAHGNTRETTPRHAWMDQVLMLARVSREDADKYCTRERMNRWYGAGEAVWMAADSLAKFVADGKRFARAERETNYLAGKMKVWR